MSSGRSYAEFEMFEADDDMDLMVGVARPDCDVEADVYESDRFWGVYSPGGDRYHNGEDSYDWHGQQGFEAAGDVLGLLREEASGGK